jgi:phosphoribosylaminoimidazole-succinocarboxamide synthase
MLSEALEYASALFLGFYMTSSPTLNRILLQTDFPELTLHARGKVRDLYSLNDQLLFVATDRISAFDYVLATGIPEKGRVLTQLSLFWFDFLKDVTSNHLITAKVDEYPDALKKYAQQLRGRSMLVNKAQMVDIECVVRGLSAHRLGLRHRAACGAARIRQAAGAYFHAGDQGPERA